MIYKVLGTLGVGFIPGAPGTYGSVLGVAIFYLMDKYLGVYYVLTFLLIVTVVGVVVSDRLNVMWKPDDGRIVIDEVAGQITALVFHGISIKTLIGGFLLFRLFDIVKPFPVNRFEKLKGGFGVMFDDIVAGVMANVVIWGVKLAYPFILSFLFST